MNFLSFLASKAEIFNFSLQAQSHQCKKETTVLVGPTEQPPPNAPAGKQKDLPVFADSLQSESQALPQPMSGAMDAEFQLIYEKMLIGQYLELKQKYIKNCLNNLEPAAPPHHTGAPAEPDSPAATKDQSQDWPIMTKKIKKLNKCGHDDKPHYAKGMCNNCYHKNGRTKKPWNCSHAKLYAAGMCQNCYINLYNKKKREEKQEAARDDQAVDPEPQV